MIENSRYDRQMMLPNFGYEGQLKLEQAKVLIVGVGALGSSCAFYLAGAGVGTLGLMDFDTVEISNLHRQIIHNQLNIGQLKVDSAAEKLAALNSTIRIITYPEIADEESIAIIAKSYDVVVDATDNFESKFLINDVCVCYGIPFVHGGIREYDGQLMTVIPGQSACYRCVFRIQPVESGNLKPLGVFGPAPGVIGTLQAAEVIKLLTGVGRLITNRLWVMTLLTMNCREVIVERCLACQSCGKLHNGRF